MINNYFKDIVEEKAYCAVHLRSKVGRNPKTMQWPEQCRQGWVNISNQKPSGCKIIVVKDGEEEGEK